MIDQLGYTGLFVLSLYSFFYGMGDYGIINGNEALYVESAREMVLSEQWAIPTLNGLPYLEKPPLFVWLLTLAAHMSDSIELAPRSVTAGAALLLTLGMVRFSVLLRIGNRGFAAGFILVTSLGVDVMSRVAMPDLLLTTLFALGCFSFLTSLHHGKLAYYRLAAALLGAASLVKGPLALALFGLIVSANYAIEPAHRKAIRNFVFDPLAAALMFLPLCLWLLIIESQLPGSAYYFIVNEHVLRFLGMREPRDYYSGSMLYYVPRLFLFIFPWAGVLLFGWLGRSQQIEPVRQQNQRFLWLCVWIPFAFFSLSSAKANYYILLCIPPMALLTAEYLPNLLRERRRFHLGMAVTVPILIFVVIWAIRIWELRSGKTERLIPIRDGSGSLTMAVLVVLLLLVLTLIQFGWRRPAILCLGGLIMPVSFQFDHLVALSEPIMSSRKLAAYIQEHYPDARVYLYQDFESVGSLPIYLKRTLPVIDSQSNDLYFGRHRQPDHTNLVTAEAVAALGPGSLVVVLKERQHAYQSTPLAKCSEEVTTIGKARLLRVGC
ncbi:MAG: glycosyltransferase family 39 protein [Proteobacteria bacterium]|nr:glycosyltransferase family 39 protein [Pseudomonadota bacterium]